MRIGTRITVATALSVTLMLTVYAAFAVRARHETRQRAAEGEARATALALRATLETTSPDLRTIDPARLAKELARELGRTGTGWRAAIVPRPPTTAAPTVQPLTPAQSQRLAKLTAGQPALYEVDGSDAVLALPVRARGTSSDVVIGMIEVGRPIAPMLPSRDPRPNLEAEARGVALPLRASLEALGPDLARVDAASWGDDVTRELSSSGTEWRARFVSALPRPALARAPLSPAQARRLGALSNAPELALLERDGGELVLALPLRRADAAGAEVTGMLEVVRPVAHLDAAWTGDLWRAIGWVVVIAALTTTAVFLLTRSLMTRPMAKLLGGVDEVARGDLSHVLLSERDDEIGAIATRFNDMTFSLRESRAETRRSADAKHSLEQRLAHTEKLATIGQIAAEIAHEVGTPLNVIAGRARATHKKLGDADAVAKNATIIEEQTARITRIIQRLLDFARRRVGPPGMSRLNLNQISLTTMELLGSQFAAAKVKTRLIRAEGLPAVLADSDRVQQVLLNLLLNAIQAMPDGGALTVETSVVTQQRPGLELAPEQAFARIEVSDTGPGIPRDRRDKIFEPFYTSKDGQGGTGLGLAVCAGIVKEHDGWIEVDDAATGGAVFRVYLPVAPPSERPRGDTGRSDTGRSETARGDTGRGGEPRADA